jgi:hypothetical protein
VLFVSGGAAAFCQVFPQSAGFRAAVSRKRCRNAGRDGLSEPSRAWRADDGAN